MLDKPGCLDFLPLIPLPPPALPVFTSDYCHLNFFSHARLLQLKPSPACTSIPYSIIQSNGVSPTFC